MPHIHVKIVGKTDEEKGKIAEDITTAVMNVLGCSDKNISVSIEDINKEDWFEKVYKPDILQHPDWLYKQPGYDMPA